jgi:hypothetical protein
LYHSAQNIHISLTDVLGQMRSERCHEVAVSGIWAQRGGQASVSSLCFKKARSSRPPWGLIFLVFRSKNGPQAVQL